MQRELCGLTYRVSLTRSPLVGIGALIARYCSPCNALALKSRRKWVGQYTDVNIGTTRCPIRRPKVRELRTAL